MNPLNNSSGTTIQNQIPDQEKNQPATKKNQKENTIANLSKLSKSHINAKVKSDATKNINNEIKKTNYDEIITFKYLIDNKPKTNDDVRFGSNEQNDLYKGLSPTAKQYAKNYGLLVLKLQRFVPILKMVSTHILIINFALLILNILIFQMQMP
jgi:hypothetical protein